ncbi:hypothetical protein QT711_10820 [Sporosarcina saromensis]|uniref:Uncharacterized protein n=1 Tax=Sporosarcina saromensis TaxID=359365 RepID=A0ABU4G9M3_9BACL|nr:hypothetical protein [Sporosarcina saromensis]
MLVIACVIAMKLFAQAQRIEDKQVEVLRKKLQSLQLNGVASSRLRTFIAADALAKVSLDGDKQQIYLWRAQSHEGELLEKPQKNMSYETFSYKAELLESVSVLADDHVLSTSNQTDLKGDEQSATSESGKVERITLLLQVTDEKYPFHPIRFYHKPNLGLVKGSADYKKVIEEVMDWFESLSELTCVKDGIEQQGDLQVNERFDWEEADSERSKLPEVEGEHAHGEFKEVTNEISHSSEVREEDLVAVNCVEVKEQEANENERIVEESSEVRTVSETKEMSEEESENKEVEKSVPYEYSHSVDSEISNVTTEPAENELSYFEKLIKQNKEQLNAERKK